MASTSRTWDTVSPPLSPWLLDAVSSMNFQRMTPVQASTIPLFMGNKDVVVEAVTGSGKTLAFLIPAIEKLLRVQDPIKKNHIGAIILSPTRELASQIFSVLESLLAFHPASAPFVSSRLDHDETDDPPSGRTASPSEHKVIAQLLLGGGTTPAQDLSLFLKRSPNLIVATPGRLLELLSSQHVHCPQSSFEILIMDEADRLLDLGFSQTLQRILSRLPKQRRTGLFSASMSEAVDQLIRVGLRNPVRVAVRVRSLTGAQDKRTPASLAMHYILTGPTQRWPIVGRLLSELEPQPQKTLIYLSTCAAVDYWQHILPAILPPQYAIIPLHGKHQPSVRTKNFAKFVNASSPSLLLTTDVAARGLDIPSVDLVIQLDPPSDPKTFIHRCGRAGRAGRKGLAVILLTRGKESDYIEFLRIRGTPITPFPAASISTLPSDPIAPTADSTVTGTPIKGVTTAVTDQKGPGPEEQQQTTMAIRAIAASDRAIHDKAQRAFVSWVRSYSAHSASSIFDVRDLDWRAQAEGWGLLRMPKMPEVKHVEGLDRGLGLSGSRAIPGFSGPEGFQLANVKYRDPAREKKRLADLEAYAEGRATTAGSKGGNHLTVEAKRARAWSRNKEVKSSREERRAKKHVKRERQRVARMGPGELVEEERLQGMIAAVRERGERGDPMTDEFNGFGD